MAKQSVDIDRLCGELVEDARRGVFKPVYLLMGDEPYYVDMVCNAIIENCIDESEKDFNEIICYGADVNADAVITAARRYPMFAERQLVVLKEAQIMKDVEELSNYCENPLESTVLVICLRGAKADKRRGLYKSAAKAGVVVESLQLKDWQVEPWISRYYASRGLSIDPDAAKLLAEFAGVDLGKIAVETDKMLKNLPEGTTRVSIRDIEQNVGISRQYTVFELNRALSEKNAAAAMKTAAYVAAAPRFQLASVIPMMYLHFNRILRLHALMAENPRADQQTKAAAIGVNPYFLKEYDMAVSRYPLRKTMSVVSLLKDYDYKGKGGEAGEATQGELLVELVARILN